MIQTSSDLTNYHRSPPPSSMTLWHGVSYRWTSSSCSRQVLEAEQTNCVLPLLVCLIFGLSMAVIAWPRTLLSACSCTSRHPTPVSPSFSPLCVFTSLLLFSLWPSAVRPAARGLGEQGRGGEWKEKRVVREKEEQEELPLFFPRTHTHTHTVSSTPPCYIIHSGAPAWGR